MRLGVLGGMFDPVHNGHIEVARLAHKVLGLDAVHLVPCHIPNHREAANASAADRLEMLQRAVSGLTGLVANSVELNRDQVSYTVDTLVEMRRQLKPDVLVLVLGMDAFNSIPGWHEWRRLFSLCHFFVVARNGEAVSIDAASALALETRRVHSADAMYTFDAGKIWIVENFRVDLSSTKVREAIRQQQDLTELLDTKVIEYINHNKLYRAAE